MFNVTDTTTWITSEYPLEQNFHRYPPSLPYTQGYIPPELSSLSEDSAGWWKYWSYFAEKYDRDGEGDDPQIVNPVKYWEICHVPSHDKNNAWRDDDWDYPWNGYEVPWSIDTLLTYGIPKLSGDTFEIITAQHYMLPIDFNPQSLFWKRMNFFIHYFRVSAKAIREAYTNHPLGIKPYIVGPSDAYQGEWDEGTPFWNTISWEIYVKDVNDSWAMLRIYPESADSTEADGQYGSSYFWHIFH